MRFIKRAMPATLGLDKSVRYRYEIAYAPVHSSRALKASPPHGGWTASLRCRQGSGNAISISIELRCVTPPVHVGGSCRSRVACSPFRTLQYTTAAMGNDSAFDPRFPPATGCSAGRTPMMRTSVISESATYGGRSSVSSWTEPTSSEKSRSAVGTSVIACFASSVGKKRAQRLSTLRQADMGALLDASACVTAATFKFRQIPRVPVPFCNSVPAMPSMPLIGRAFCSACRRPTKAISQLLEFPMRKCCLGTQMPKGSWTPAFTPKRALRSTQDNVGEKDTPIVAYFPTWKGGFRNERLRHYFHVDMARLLEADPNVEMWTTDFVALPLADDPSGRGFKPAFRVVGKDCIRFVHLIDSPVKSGARRERHDVLRERCRTQGMIFEVLTRSEVEQHPRLATSREILFYRSLDTPPELPVMASAVMAVSGPLTLGELHKRLGGGFALWEQVVSLVGKGHIDVDMSMPLGPNMTILSVNPVGYLR
jgi:hypothetical protein